MFSEIFCSRDPPNIVLLMICELEICVLLNFLCSYTIFHRYHTLPQDAQCGLPLHASSYPLSWGKFSHIQGISTSLSRPQRQPLPSLWRSSCQDTYSLHLQCKMVKHCLWCIQHINLLWLAFEVP